MEAEISFISHRRISWSAIVCDSDLTSGLTLCELFVNLFLHCKLYTEKFGVWAGESGTFVRGKLEFRLGKVPVSLVQSRELCNWQEIRQIEKRPQKETNNEFI